MEKTITEYHFSAEELAVSCQDILQGSPDTPVLADAGMFGLISDLVANSARHLEVCAGWLRLPDLPLSLSTETLSLGSQVFNCGAPVAEGLRGSSSAVLFAVSCGDKFAYWADGFFQVDDPLSGFICVSIAEAAMDKAVCLLTERLESVLAGTGLQQSSSYSIGAGGWSTEDTAVLFDLLPAGFCGIRVNPAGLLQPVNSRCGIIGVGEAARKRSDFPVNTEHPDQGRRSRFFRCLARKPA